MRFSAPPGWRRIPAVTRALLVLVAAGYLLTLAAPTVAIWLALVPGTVLAGQVWRLAHLRTRECVDHERSLRSSPDVEPRQRDRARVGLTPVRAVPRERDGPCWRPWTLSSAAARASRRPLLALIFAWMLEGPSQHVSLFGLLPMTRLGFAILALVFAVFSELEQTRSLPRLSSSSAACPSRGSSSAGSGAADRAFRE